MSKEVEVHVGESLGELGAGVVDAWHRIRRGEDVQERHVSFESRESFVAVMTPKRLELLRHVHKSPARSIRALALVLGRDYRRVHEDAETLVNAGLLDRTRTACGRSTTASTPRHGSICSQRYHRSHESSRHATPPLPLADRSRERAGVRVTRGTRRHQAERGEASGDIAHIACLARLRRATEQRPFAIGKPFLQHLITADGEAPDRFGDVAPTGVRVEEHVLCARAEQRGFCRRSDARGRAERVAFTPETPIPELDPASVERWTFHALPNGIRPEFLSRSGRTRCAWAGFSGSRRAKRGRPIRRRRRPAGSPS